MSAVTVPIRLESWYLCRWHRGWQAGPPLRGGAVPRQSPFLSLELELPWLLPLLLLLPSPSPLHCGPGARPAAPWTALRHVRACWGTCAAQALCTHAGGTSRCVPTAHMHAPWSHRTSLTKHKFKTKVIEIFQGSNSIGLNQAWSPSEWGPVQGQRLRAHEAGPAGGPTIYQASGFELYIQDMRWWGNDGTDTFLPWC